MLVEIPGEMNTFSRIAVTCLNLSFWEDSLPSVDAIDYLYGRSPGISVKIRHAVTLAPLGIMEAQLRASLMALNIRAI